MKKKILIIRFSSFGDIVQAMGVIPTLRRAYPTADIDWVVKKNFADVLALDPNICRVWVFRPSSDKIKEIFELLDLAKKINQFRYDLIYDAHYNLRSLILRLFLKILMLLSFAIFVRGKDGGSRGNGSSGKAFPQIICRKKNRIKRWLLFSFRINLFPSPFRGIESYLSPLMVVNDFAKFANFTPALWNFGKLQKDPHLQNKINIPPEKIIITIAPSAAWEKKRWPLGHFEKLLQLLMSSPANLGVDAKNLFFFFIGGSEDNFASSLATMVAERGRNLIGKLSYSESSYLISKSDLLISADTGILHVADLLGTAAIALIGPTAFGFPSGQSVKVLMAQGDWKCRPCSKDGSGRCTDKIFKRCLLEIKPDVVVGEIVQAIRTS